MLRRLFLLFFSLSISLSFIACHSTSGTGTYFAFRKERFRAQIDGTLHGVTFSAEIGQYTRDEKSILYIKYSSPEALENVTLQKEEGGEPYVLYGDLLSAAQEERIRGLILPLSALWQTDEILRIQKSEEGTELIFSGERSLFLSKEGIPRRFSAPEAHFTVVWWEGESTK